METTNEVDNPINNPNMDPSIQEPANEEIHVSIQVPEESTNLETNSENGIEMKPLKHVPSKSVRIDVPITEKELEDENQSEIPQIRPKSASQRRASNRKSWRMTFSSDFNRLLSPGETELDIEILEKDVNSHKSYDLEVKYGIPKSQMQFIVKQFKTSNADKNKDGKIDLEEWNEFIDNQIKQPLENHPKANAVAQVFAYSEKWTCTPPKLFIPTITFLQFLFHVLATYAPQSIGAGYPNESDGTLTYGNALRCSCLIYNPNRRNDIWRFGTYMFLHSGWHHLFWNIGIQLMVGIPLEMGQPGRKGSLRVAGLFMAGIFVGGLGAGIAESEKYLVGSSPGTYALIMAHLATIVLNWTEDGQLDDEQNKKESKIRYRAYLNKNIRIFRLLFVLAFMLTDAGLTINNVIKCKNQKNKIQNEGTADNYCKDVSRAGHGFGALIGLTVGVFILKNRKIEDWERKLQIIAFIIFSIFVGTLIVWHIAGDFTHTFHYGSIECPNAFCSFEK